MRLTPRAAVASPAPTNRRPSPYVGPRSYLRTEAAKLRGRTREIAALVDQLIADRIVLLYSPSGAGKSSLIQAGVLPQLEQQGFHTLPVIRVGLRARAALALPAGANRYVVSAITALEAERDPDPPVERLSMPLCDYLSRREAGIPAPRSTLLVFDQFEEVLTLDPTDVAAKQDFFRQLGQALKVRDRWALLAMREEYVTSLDPYAGLVPTRFGSRFRLEPLDETAATEAIREPAEVAGVTFDEGAARTLVDNLRTVRVLQLTGPANVPGPFVEPVQLQVVCQRIWEKLGPQQQAIGPADVQNISVDGALANYYEDRIAEVVRGGDVDERTLRHWVDRHLIVDRTIRGQVPASEDGMVGGLPVAVVQRLVAAFLVRAENRGGAVWYELSHDRLVRPISESNARWLQENASPLQLQAAQWIDSGKDDAWLLTGRALEDAQAWAKGNTAELEGTAKVYLDASRSAATKRQRMRSRGLAAALVVALALLAWSVLATYEARRALAREKAARGELAQRDTQTRALDSTLDVRSDSVQSLSKVLASRYLKTESDTGDVSKVQLALRANAAIVQATRPGTATSGARGGTRVRYLSRAVDEHRVGDALQELGFQLERVESRSESPTNAVAFDPAGVPVEHVRLVVLALLRAGIEVKKVKPFTNTGSRARMIEVYGDSRLAGPSSPTWTVAQAMAYRPENRPTPSPPPGQRGTSSATGARPR